MRFVPSTAPWPPPPDLESIQELVAAADIENFIVEGAPIDEYEAEAELLFSAVRNLATLDLTYGNIAPLVEDIWRRSFKLDDGAISQRRPAIESLAAQIARFFGPEAVPLVR